MRELDALLAPGRAAFNRGEYFAAHERWEDVWRGLAGDERTLVQGLIQVAAGLHHLQRGRPGPAARVIARGLRKLACGEAKPGSPIAVLVRDVGRVVAAVEAGGSGAGDLGVIRF